MGVLAVVAAAAILLMQTGGSNGSETAERRSKATAETEAPQPAPVRPPTVIWQADAARSWRALAASVPAQVGLVAAPLGRGATRSFGPLQTGHAWSSIKVPLLVTLLRDREPGALDAAESELARAALTASDNDAAASLFDLIEAEHGDLAAASAEMDSVLRAAGDRTTTIATAPPPPGAVSTYGQTQWSLKDSATFFRSLARGCLLNENGTARVLGLMEEVVPEQRWGLGETAFPAAWKVGMKGGWGPEGSATGPYLVRQSGVIESGSAGIAVAMMAQADSGSFEGGVEAVNRVADWLTASLQSLGAPAAPC